MGFKTKIVNIISVTNSIIMKKEFTMFSKVEEAIISTLKNNVKTVPKENIGVKRIKLDSLPAISLSNVDFEAKEVGLGRTVGGVEQQETFSGDARTTSFPLKLKPLKPIISIEYPLGSKLKEDNYTVDYEKGILTFPSPPKKAKENIMVKYLKPTEMKGLRFNLRYNLNVWAKDETQRDSITIEVMETLLREEDPFNKEDITIKPIKGYNTPPNEEVPRGIQGKTLEYLVESGLQVEVPTPRMEKIEIKGQ